MKRHEGRTRRRFLAALGALPVSLHGLRGEAQSRQLEVASYFLGPTLVGLGMQPFVDKVAAGSSGTLQLSLEMVAPTMPFAMMSEASAFAHYSPSLFARSEPIFGLSALPMIAATFDEAETLLRIARPYYSSTLARHGQILLAAEPWQPGALWSTFRIRSIADLKGVPFAVSPTIGERTGSERFFARLGVRPASFTDAEVMLSNGYNHSLKFTQEFAYLTEIFFPAPLNFLTASRKVFDSLTETQRQVLVTAGQETELDLWKFNREFLIRATRDIVARGVSVAPRAPADVLTALCTAAEPDIQSWVRSMGADGETILADYRRVIGREWP